MSTASPNSPKLAKIRAKMDPLSFLIDEGQPNFREVPTRETLLRDISETFFTLIFFFVFEIFDRFS